jgi:hypothetical protein
VALTAIARRTRAAFRRHPWALEGLRGAEGGPNGVRHFEQSLAAVEGTGLDNHGKLQLIGLVDDYVIGFVTREAAQRGATPAAAAELAGRAPDAMVAWLESLMAGGDFPHLARLAGGRGARSTVAFLASVLLDEGRFERGLATLLDGVEQRLPRS